ncbi:MAG TPA: RIO1 family regulatory kinase/ATPase [Nitrososphaeraceae archaeon]|nr:RIO1 family regulatory kinase/ATPase [Nitrososphaeraceae archaeon]
MSSLKESANIVRNLGNLEFRILKIFVSSLKHHEIINNQEIVSYSNLHKDRIDYGLKNLLKLKLISKSEKGFKLITAGLDVYALKILVDSDIISRIGNPLGIGKESDVVEAVSELDQERAVKFFRIGRISFTDTKRKRSIEKKRNIHNWLLINIEAAKREYDFLVKLKETKMKISTPYFRSMHSIVMYRINGVRLVDYKHLPNPKEILNKTFEQIKIAYKANIINGDLSEYNIILDKNNDIWIIDWPQAVTLDHPNAEFLIKRDIQNVIRFFKRKYDLQIDENYYLKYILQK